MITILLPIYNGIEFINESVSSVIRQTYDDWELIIGINGYSPNSQTYKRAKEYEHISPKIRVFDFYMIKGKSNTLNHMLQYSNYDYIAILDVDDIWLPPKLSLQSIYLNKYDVIGSQCIYFGDTRPLVPSIPTGDITTYDFFQQNPIINSSSVILKKHCHWEENGIEDYDLWLRLRYVHKCSFYNFGQVLVKHRIHHSSAFNSKGNHLLVPELLIKYKSSRSLKN